MKERGGRPKGSKNKRHKSDSLKIWTSEHEIEFIKTLDQKNRKLYKESIVHRTNWGTLSRWRILDYLGIL